MYSYSLGLYEKAFPVSSPLRDKLEAAKRCGFDHMELCIDPEPSRAERINWTLRQARDVRHMAEDVGVPFKTFSLTLLRKWPLGLPSQADNEKAFDVLKKGVDIASELGSRVMLINGYDVYGEPSTPETRAHFMENLPRVVEICSRAGMPVGIENAEQEFCFSVTRAMEIISGISSPFIGVYADMGNSANSVNGDVDASMADIRTGAGHIFAMHVKDTVPGEYRYTRYGEGHVNFDRAIALAKELEIRLFTAELFCRTDDFAEAEKEALRVDRFIRGYFDKEI